MTKKSLKFSKFQNATQNILQLADIFRISPRFLDEVVKVEFIIF